MAAKDWLPKVVMVLNIVVGVIVAATAVLWAVHWASHMGYIEYLFLAVAMFVLGCILIMVEIGVKRGEIYE